MANVSKSARNVKPVIADATKPAASVKAANKPRVIQAASKPAAPTVPVKPEPAKPASVEPAAPLSRLGRFEIRDAAYLARAAYPFENISAADTAYLALFAGFCKAASNGIASVAAIDDSGAKPLGVSILNNRARLHRLAQAGHVEYIGADGKPTTARGLNFRIADKAKTLAVYTSAKPRA